MMAKKWCHPQKDSWSTSEPYNKQHWPHWLPTIPVVESSCHWQFQSWSRWIHPFQIIWMILQKKSLAVFVWHHFDTPICSVGTVNSPGAGLHRCGFWDFRMPSCGGSQPACWGWGLYPPEKHVMSMETCHFLRRRYIFFKWLFCLQLSS